MRPRPDMRTATEYTRTSSVSVASPLASLITGLCLWTYKRERAWWFNRSRTCSWIFCAIHLGPALRDEVPVVVDEFQDTSPIQLAIFRALREIAVEISGCDASSHLRIPGNRYDAGRRSVLSLPPPAPSPKSIKELAQVRVGWLRHQRAVRSRVRVTTSRSKRFVQPPRPIRIARTLERGVSPHKKTITGRD